MSGSNGGPETGTPPNPISVFVSRYFAHTEPERTRQITLAVAELAKKMGSQLFLMVAAKIVAATFWEGGAAGPTEEEIRERIRKTSEILSACGFSDIDAGKLFATLLLMAKMFPRSKI